MLLRCFRLLKLPILAATAGCCIVSLPALSFAQTGSPPPPPTAAAPAPTAAAPPAALTTGDDGSSDDSDSSSDDSDSSSDDSDSSSDDDSAWAELDDSEAQRNARIPMVLPDFSRQPLPPGADWEPPPAHSWIWRNVTGARYNAQGLSTQIQTGYRLQLWQLPGQLYEQSFFAIKGNAQITPAFGKFGGVVEFQPLAILNLSVGVDYVSSFGSFRFLLPLRDANQAHDDDTNDTREDNGESRSDSGYQVTLGALLQAKVGNIAVRNRTSGYYMDMSIPDGNTAFYDTNLDVAFPNGGWVLNNDTDLLYLTDFGLRFGARYTYTRAYYDDDISNAAHVPMHRVGPALIYTFFEDPSPALYNAPTLALLVQWWAKHRYRTGATSSAALPQFLLAFIHRGDLITSD